MHCRYKYMPQGCRQHVSKIQIICLKATNSILQIRNLYVVHTDFLCCKYTHCICQTSRFVCITNTESVSLCFTDPESVLSKLGATGCAPAGAVSPPKTPSIFYKYRIFVFEFLYFLSSVLPSALPQGLFPSKNTPSIFYK